MFSLEVSVFIGRSIALISYPEGSLADILNIKGSRNATLSNEVKVPLSKRKNPLSQLIWAVQKAKREKKALRIINIYHI